MEELIQEIILCIYIDTPYFNQLDPQNLTKYVMNFMIFLDGEQIIYLFLFLKKKKSLLITFLLIIKCIYSIN